MALDLSGFVGKEDQFEGLYKLGDNLQKNNILKEQKKKQLLDAENKHEGDLLKVIDDHKKPEYANTGTVRDPSITLKMYSVIKEGQDLVDKYKGKGLSTSALRTILAPQVEEIAVLSSTLKAYQEQKKIYLETLKTKKGFNADVISRAIDKVALYNPDGTEKKASEIDPRRFGDYVNEAFKTESGLAAPLGDIGTVLRARDFSERDATVKVTNSRGGSSMERRKVKMYDWMQADNEGNLVPKFEHATDGDDFVKHKFADQDKEGKVRLIERNTFDNAIKDDEAYHRYLIEEVRKAGYTGDFINDETSYNAARAIAYKDFSQYTNKVILTNDADKQNPVTNVNVRVNAGGGSGSGVPLVQVFGSIKADLADMKSKGINYLPVEQMKNTTARNIVLTEANKGGSDYKPSQLRIVEGDDGTTRVFTNAGEFVTYVNATEMDRAGNKGGGQKANNEIIRRSKNQPTNKPAQKTGESGVTWGKKK